MSGTGVRPGLSGRAFRLAIVMLAAMTAGIVLASPAWALSMSISPNEGKPGSSVTLQLSQMKLPCEVTFGGQVVVSKSACTPGADGTATVSFTVPPSTAEGSHQVTATSSDSQTSEQSSTSFIVKGTAASPSPTPSPKPSPSPKPTPSPKASATPTRSPTPVPSGVAPTPSPGAVGAAPDACTVGPSLVEDLVVSPESVPPEGNPAVTIYWTPATAGCPQALTRLTLDGSAVGETIPVGTSSTRISLPISEDLTPGTHDIELRGEDGQGILLARTAFEVERPPSSTMTLLAVAAGLLLALALGRKFLAPRLRFRRFGHKG